MSEESNQPSENESRLKAIDSILEDFDWERVKEVMELLNWKWGVPDVGELPSFSEMLKVAKRLLTEASEMGGHPATVQSGGFIATAHSPTWLSLSFSVAYSDNFRTED